MKRLCKLNSGVKTQTRNPAGNRARNHAKWPVLLLLAASLAACSQPVYEVRNQPIQYAHTADPLSHIEDSIDRARKNYARRLLQANETKLLESARSAMFELMALRFMAVPRAPDPGEAVRALLEALAAEEPA